MDNMKLRNNFVLSYICNEIVSVAHEHAHSQTDTSKHTEGVSSDMSLHALLLHNLYYI